MIKNKVTKKQLKNLIPERDQQRLCLEFLNLIGAVAYRTNSGCARYENRNGTQRMVRFAGVKGLPDISGYIPRDNAPAITFYWEVKREGGKPTQDQKEFIETAKNGGCFAGWGTCEALEYQLSKCDWL